MREKDKKKDRSGRERETETERQGLEREIGRETGVRER